LDRFDAMSVLLTAVECGSLSKASRKLGVPLATVSRRVAELEEHLKASLLIRSAKGLELTPTGRTFVTSARAILEHLDEAERTAAGEYTEPKGDLVVTAPVMFGRLHVLPAVTRFLDSFPDVAVGLVMTDRVAHFLEDQIDLAVRIGDLPDSSLIATRVGEVRHVICASPAYLAANGTPSEPQELKLHKLVSFDSVSASSSWTFQVNGASESVTFRSRLSVNTIEAAIDAGVSGIGLIRAMSYQVSELVRAGRLALVLTEFESKPRPVHLVYAGQSRLPLKLRAFIDFMVPRLREQLTQVTLQIA
jgi:DNA-binding transcriptional LysR family regulator